MDYEKKQDLAAYLIHEVERLNKMQAKAFLEGEKWALEKTKHRIIEEVLEEKFDEIADEECPRK